MLQLFDGRVAAQHDGTEVIDPRPPGFSLRRQGLTDK
jgi:hypothetical protein